MSEYGTVGETLVAEEAPPGADPRARRAGLAPTTRAASLLVIGVLKGAVFFIADLLRHLTVPCELDFMAVSSTAPRPTRRASCGS